MSRSKKGTIINRRKSALAHLEIYMQNPAYSDSDRERMKREIETLKARIAGK